MGLFINTNSASIGAQASFFNNTQAVNSSLEKLSTGLRINKASDDAAGLQISESLRSQIRGSEQAFQNVQDGISVLNVADGAFGQITDNVQRVRELAVQAANDTLSVDQRNAIGAEIIQLSADIDRIAGATEFNGKGLLNGSQATFAIQLGPESAAGTNQLDLTTASGTNPFGDATSGSLGLTGIAVNTAAGAAAAIATADTVLTEIGNRRSTIGALTNRLEGAGNNLQVQIENFSASESRIRNVDIAKESANLTRNQILQQASASVLAQANAGPQLALSLI